ncbi:DUF5979 domain-containing protein [Microbacterium rhizomatis]|uniref:DUF5979 domain-containing protein n=1 Tax=Microbacterium rhizomatis TaxID=1631477 RepID=UPI001B866E7A|nr:DUF5979 domain-containing protein [Microbacterium rhizomatis]
MATIAASAVAIGAPAAAAGDTAVLSQLKTVVGSQTNFAPGDTFQYQIDLGCSSTIDPSCRNTKITDILPAPLVLDPSDPSPVSATTSPNAPVDIALSGNNGFTVTPRLSAGGSAGLPAGGSMTVFVSVQVPTTTGADFNGQTITNTSLATADNAQDDQSSADITLTVTTTLFASLSKTVSPTSTLPAAAGRTVDWTLVPGNASNQTVDTITVQDPITPPGPFTYLDITSVDITDPAGATGRATEYYVGGVWTATPPTPISLAKGVRVVFTGSFAPGVTGNVVVHSVTNDTVSSIPNGQTVDVQNDASTTVTKSGVDSPVVTDTASVSIAAVDPDVSITKSFLDSTLVAGQSTTIAIVATNGAQDVQTLTVTEPSSGEPGFTAQGLAFNGFGPTLAWPVAASSATILYTYSGSGCSTLPQTTTTPQTLPAPQNGCTVEGFTVTYASTGDGITAGGYAALPLLVTALPVPTLAPVSSTNVVDTQVVNSDGASGEATASTPFTIDPLRIDTVVSKSITPTEAFAVPGASISIALSGKVSDDSTVGSTKLEISDPVDPAATPDFWNTFAPTAVRNTDIPGCSSLELSYYSKASGDWVDFPGAGNVAGPVAGYTYPIPSALRSDIGGIRFTFRPLLTSPCTGTLPPGFTVLPNIAAEVREYSDVSSVHTNDVRSAVNNPVAVEPDAIDDASAPITLQPINGGDGPDFVDKAWLDATLPAQVPALSAQTRTARLSWSTQGLNLTSMTLTDPASTGELTNPATSVYDAFDLVAIKPITPSTDPLIVNDVVTRVELYSTTANDWVDITAAACALGCDGGFGGYALSTAQQADTLGVRVTFTEKTAGAGVGTSYTGRPFDLDYRIRDTLRSDPTQYVLGQYHSYTYNTTTPGLVNNTVSARGQNPSIDFDSTSTDADTIQVIDSPVNVTLTKSFDQTVLGLPQAGTPQANYPLISGTITSRNQSNTKIASMVIDDPSPGQVAPTAFETLNLYSIDTLTPPKPLTAADVTVTLTREGGGVDLPISGDAAKLLTPDQLDDVVGISVRYADAAGRPIIVAATPDSNDAAGVVGLTWQLRATQRTSGDPIAVTEPGGEPIVNVAHTALDSPGRIPCVNGQNIPGCSTGEFYASSQFNIVAADYSIFTDKAINPASVLENGSKNYTTTLTARPNGNARTYLATVSDSTPTFWNTMTFVGARITVPQPVNQVAMDVLVNDATRVVAYSVVGGALVATCNGLPLDQTSPCWATGDWVTANPGSAVTFGLPGGVSAGDVVGTRFRAQEVVDGEVVVWERPYNPKLDFVVQTTRRDFLRSDPSVPVSTTRPGVAPNPGETVSGTITNTVVTDGNARFGASQLYTGHAEKTTTTRVTHLVNQIRVTKTRGTTALYPAGSTVPFTMVVTNTGRWDMTGFTVVDQITPVGGSSPMVEPNPAQYSFAITGPSAPSGSAGFSASLDAGTGLLSIVNSDPNFVFKAGWTLTIKAGLNFRAGLSPDVTVQNAVTATSDRAFEKCESTSTDLRPKPDETNVASCTANTSVTPRAAATVSLKKWVKGELAGDPKDPTADDLGVLNVDDTIAGGSGSACDSTTDAPRDAGYYDEARFYSYPCAPITRPGGLERWRLDFTNTGNANAKVLAMVDTLPAVGDKGVITTNPRGSQFPVTLVGNVQTNITTLRDASDAQVAAYFSTVVLSADCNKNAINVHTANSAPLPSCVFNWTPFTSSTPESDLVNAKSVKYVVTFTPTVAKPTPGLAPGEVLSLTYSTRTPYVLPKETAISQGASTAYNSFAGASRSVATLTQPETPQVPLEPQRVAVATSTGQLQMSKSVVAPSFSTPIQLPTTYPLLVTCVSGGEPVTLLYASGGDASRPTVAADGTLLVYDDPTGPVNLPLFADCTVVEDPVPPGATSVITPPTALTAERDLSSNPRIFNGYAGDPTQSFFGIENTFTAGGFVVSKSIDNGGAVDQDGTPIAYNSLFGFTASCTYLGQEAVPEGDRSFALADGESKTFTGIPTGATCVVTETDTAGAASTTVNGVPQEGTPTSSFTIEEGETPAFTAAFVNNYTVGSVQVTKQITGTGADAWGQGPFTFQLVCTLDAATPSVVYSATHDVTPDEPTWTVDDLPTGATCAVSEPDNAGATESTFSPESRTVTVGVADQDEPALVTVTNDFRTGGLRIAKTLSGPGVPDFGRGPFVFSVVCTYQDATVYTGDLTVRTDGEHPLFSDTVTGIPVGAVCVIRETDSAGADDVPGPTTITIPDEENGVPQVATTDPFVNEFSVAELTLTKTLDGAGATADYATSAVFTVVVTCEMEAGDGSMITLLDSPYDIKGGETITLTDADGNPVRMRAGAHCYGTETVTGGATASVVTPDNYEDGLVVQPGAEVQTLALEATNTFDPGILALSKVVTGTAAEGNASKTFTLDLTCVLDQGQETPTVLIDHRAVTITGGQTIRIEDLPIGAQCWVAETDNGGADRVEITNSTAAMPAVVASDPVTITVTNTFTAPLPATGVDGRALLIAGGVAGILILAGVVVMIVMRRRRRD